MVGPSFLSVGASSPVSGLAQHSVVPVIPVLTQAMDITTDLINSTIADLDMILGQQLGAGLTTTPVTA